MSIYRTGLQGRNSKYDEKPAGTSVGCADHWAVGLLQAVKTAMIRNMESMKLKYYIFTF